MAPTSSSSIEIVAVRRARSTQVNCPSIATFRRQLEALPFDDSRLTTWLGLTPSVANDVQSQASSSCKTECHIRRDGEGEEKRYGGQEDHSAQNNINNDNAEELTASRERSLYSPTSVCNDSSSHIDNHQRDSNWRLESAGFYPQSPTPSDQPKTVAATHDSRERHEIRGAVNENALHFRRDRNSIWSFVIPGTADDGLHATSLLPTEGRLTRNELDPSVDGHSGYLADCSDLESSEAPTRATNMLPTLGSGSQYTQNATVGGISSLDGRQDRDEGHDLAQRPTNRIAPRPSQPRHSSTPKLDSPYAVVITTPSPYSTQLQPPHLLIGMGRQLEGIQNGKVPQHQRLSTSRIVPPSRPTKASRIVPPPRQSTARPVKSFAPSVNYTSSGISSATLEGDPVRNNSGLTVEVSSKSPLDVSKKRGRSFSIPQTAAKATGNPTTSEIRLAPPKKRGRPFSTPQAAAKAAAKATAKAEVVNSASTGQIKKRKRPVESSKAGSSYDEPKKRPKALDGRPFVPPEPQYVPFICEWEGCPAELHNLETLRTHVYVIHYKWRDTGIACRWGKCGGSDKDGKGASVLGGVKRDVLYMTKADWKDHMEEDHLIPFAWHMGDGPKAPSLNGTVETDLRVSEPWLFDASGRQVTPSIRGQRIEGGDARFNNFRRFQKMVRQGIYSVSETTDSSAEMVTDEAANDDQPNAPLAMNTVNSNPTSDGIMIVPPTVKRPQDYQKVTIVISDDEDDQVLHKPNDEVADSDEEMDDFYAF